jgi:hypothetical protein
MAAHRAQQREIVLSNHLNSGMLGLQYALPDAEGPLVQGLGRLITPLGLVGFPEESEKFCTLDDISLLDKHLRALSKDAAYMRIRASASHDGPPAANTLMPSLG